jgi:hypothetical protein
MKVTAGPSAAHGCQSWAAVLRRFLDSPDEVCRVSLVMRRGIKIRVAFLPTRLSAEHLRAAYEVVTPVVERTIIPTNNADSARSRERRQGVSQGQGQR